MAANQSGWTKKYLTRIFTELAADTLKVALYPANVSLDPDTVVTYSASDEIVPSGDYSAGGVTLTPVLDTSGRVPFIDFADIEITGFTGSFQTLVFYNTSQANEVFAVVRLPRARSYSAQSFRLKFPAADVNNALLRALAPMTGG